MVYYVSVPVRKLERAAVLNDVNVNFVSGNFSSSIAVDQGRVYSLESAWTDGRWLTRPWSCIAGNTDN